MVEVIRDFGMGILMAIGVVALALIVSGVMDMVDRSGWDLE